MTLERLVTETRAEQLFGNQGVRPLDALLAERLAAMSVNDTFIIDPLPPGMTPQSIKTYYNQNARLAGIHLRWRRGDNPVAAQVVAEPTREELYAERRRLATRRHRSNSGAQRLIATPANGSLGPLMAAQREAEMQAQADDSLAPAPLQITTDLDWLPLREASIYHAERLR